MNIHNLFLILLILLPLRGSLILHLGFSPALIYKGTSILFLSTSTIIIIYMFFFKNYKKFKKFKYISLILCFFSTYYAVTHIVLLGINSITLLYLSFFAPLCIYCTKLSTDYLTRGLLVIYLTTTIGVYYLFIIGLFDISNLDRVQNLLRPKEYHAATIGTIPRVGGYQGSNHDAANILTIIGIFLLANIMSKKSKYKLISILSLLLGTPALLITTSASNISVFIFTAVIMLICYAKNILKFSALLLFISIFFISLYYFSNEYLFIFLKKFINHSEASDGGMFNSLDGEYIYASLFSFLLGFAYPLELPIINTEIGLLKLLVTLGIIPFSLLVYFLTLPFIICLKNRLNYHFSFYSFPIISCLLTLLHYGSLFRITSIGILVLLYSLFLNKYTSYMHSKNTFG